MAAWKTERALAGGRPSDPVPVVGEAPTVGNKLDGSVGEMPVPEIDGSVPGTCSVAGGIVVPDGLAEVLVDCTATTSVAVAENDFAPAAEACAVIRTCSPDAALACTWAIAWSSSAWPTGKLPILQVAPLRDGQTVNLGLPMCGADATATLTVMPVLAAFVVHTQITKLAFAPAVTFADDGNGWTRTHSCEAFCPGAGDVDEPLGAGLGDVLPLGLGLGLGLDELSLGVGEGVGVVDALELELVDGAGDEDPGAEDCGADVLGFDDGLLLAAVLGDGDVLAEEDELPPAEEPPDADELPEPGELLDVWALAEADVVW